MDYRNLPKHRGSWRTRRPGPRIILPGLAAAALAVMLAAGLTAATGPKKATPQKDGAQGKAACVDADGDGYGKNCEKGEDCSDSDPTRNPGAPDLCDFIDNNCNTFVDEICPMSPPDAASRLTIPAGAFVMGSRPGKGSKDEHPMHTVTLEGFRIDAVEVTVGRYKECVQAGACTPPRSTSSALRDDYYDNPDFNDYPVVNVDWHQADAFCTWTGGRLPTEAQWEKAARGPAPDERIYPWGDGQPLCALANFGGLDRGCLGDTDLVGRRTLGKSPFGLLDMAGNVWEWVSDWYDSLYYKKSGSKNPVGPDWGIYKVIRGGCYEEGPENIRVSCRASNLPGTKADNIGFRCAWDKK